MEKEKDTTATPPAAKVIVTFVSASASDAKSGNKMEWLKRISATKIQMRFFIFISPINITVGHQLLWIRY
jgi:hypothetical protein